MKKAKLNENGFHTYCKRHNCLYKILCEHLRCILSCHLFSIFCKLEIYLHMTLKVTSSVFVNKSLLIYKRSYNFTRELTNYLYVKSNKTIGTYLLPIPREGRLQSLRLKINRKNQLISYNILLQFFCYCCPLKVITSGLRYE